FPDGNRIVRLETAATANPDVPFGVSTELLRRLQTSSQALEAFAASRSRRYQFGGDAQHDTVAGAQITPSFTKMLRIRPVLGRDFSSDDARAGAPPVTMIGYGLWQA